MLLFDNPQLWLVLCFPFSCAPPFLWQLTVFHSLMFLYPRREMTFAVYLALAVNEYIMEAKKYG
jgi:hypothetical protein